MRLLHPARRPRAASISVLLVLALAIAVVLAWQAAGASQHQKAQAERVLQDYSRFAAARFASRSVGYLFYYSFLPALKEIDHEFAKMGRVPDPTHLALPDDSEGAAIAAPFYRRIHVTYEFDTITHHLLFGGSKPSALWQRWLADTIIARLRTLPPPTMEDVAAVIGGPQGELPKLVVFTLPRATGGQARVFGLLGDIDGMNSAFVSADTSRPLIDPALTGGVALDSIGSVVVRDAHGLPLYRSQVQYTSSITAHDTLGSYFANMSVDVSLRPGIAGKLVIGGLPRSRLPLLFTLLLVTTGLMVIAMIQLRRESELSALRTQFVSGVSHELRTPLAQIRMFAETLLLGRVRSEEERKHSLQIIDQEARRLAHLVENLLHFSRSEREALHIAPRPTVLAPLIRGVLESFWPIAETRCVRLATSLPDGVTGRVDDASMRQILLNLLDNAVKYGPEGQTVTVGIDPIVDDRIRLWVQDQGPGVPAGDRDRIWERFWRLERDRSSAVGGTGIGLSVVRDLVALHGGREWVETAPGGGARFVIEIPVVSVSLTGAAAE